MSVRVGFIGSAHSVARLAGAEAQLPGIALRSYPYSDPHDTAEQYRRALAENDAVCFSGTISHYHRERELDGDTPVLVGRFSDYTLVASLLAATAGGQPKVRPGDLAQRPLTIPEISIDMPNPEVAAAVARDTGIHLDPAQVTDYRWVYESRFSRPVDVDEIARFHADRAEQAGARLAITSVHAVYDRLHAAGQPVMFMIDSLQHDLDLIRTAQQRVSVQRLEGGLIAVVYLTTTAPADADSPATELRAHLAGELGRFATPVQHRLASWQRGGLDMFYTTRGELDTRLPALTAALRRAGPSERAASLGVGVGQHLYEAEDRALQALRRAIAQADTAAFLVDEASRVHALLGDPGAADSAEEARHTEPWLIELAASAGMQARSVTRLIAFLAGRDFAPFTAAEWAAASQTSPRTAERAVRKLLDASALRVAGQEQPLDAGRPRTVYALSEELEAAARQRRAGSGDPAQMHTSFHPRGTGA
ncbi:hypothetical protein [Leucobacter chromiireducens]|uniref:MarR family transcriptional regulator n=1 Tax=Leucobacter chromiireducens subsp. chromiireducens TaxID=660067 RepID=A0ABS1SPS4_9MICO|nr:hypothetical protein [Leucobacter chromiireducens]MBL3689920.1 hypothetical protein [Leucobacter chromiireducens subsp. chromiireducens]